MYKQRVKDVSPLFLERICITFIGYKMWSIIVKKKSHCHLNLNYNEQFILLSISSLFILPLNVPFLRQFMMLKECPSYLLFLCI